MSDLTRNLASAWQTEEEAAAPNPDAFPELLAMAESQLENGVESFRPLLPHFEQLRTKLVTAVNNLQALLSGSDKPPEEIQAVGEENVRSFNEAVEILDELLALEPDDESESYWDALGMLDESMENLANACLEMQAATDSPRKS